MDGQTTSEDAVDDKYGHLGGGMPEAKENEEDKGKDVARVRREEFLNIYKEENTGQEDEGGQTDLSNGIRFKRDEEDESGFTLKTS